MVWGRWNIDNAILDVLRQITTKLDVVETSQRRGAHLEDVSDDEAVAPSPNLDSEEDQDEEILLRVLSRAHSKPIVEVDPYDGKLDINVMLDWISDMEKYFEYQKLLIIGRKILQLQGWKVMLYCGQRIFKLIDKEEERERSKLGKKWWAR